LCLIAQVLSLYIFQFIYKDLICVFFRPYLYFCQEVLPKYHEVTTNSQYKNIYVNITKKQVEDVAIVFYFR